jgi:D-glycero-D-manno-heptose 1,7-bisphosphate phosphatase
MTRPLVILDRDGVINEDSDSYIRSPDEWHPVSGSLEAIASLSKSGFLVAVATNQSGIARGYFDEITLANIHNLLYTEVEKLGGEISALCYCPHLPTDNCTCRKPATGLIDQIESQLEQSASDAWFIGDSLKDLQTARAKNCKPVLVLSGKGTTTQSTINKEDWPDLLIFNNLAHAVDFILQTNVLDNQP